MNNDLVIANVNIIERALRELAALTGEMHISAYIVDGCFSLDSFANENGQKVLSFFRTEADNGTHK